MASKVYGNRSPTTGSTAPGRSAPLRSPFKVQPAPLSKAGAASPDPQTQEETARLHGHNLATIKAGAGTGIQRKPLVGAGGVIQAHSKAKKKKETTAERQRRTGLTTGRAFAQHGIQVERKPHDAGSAGASGSSRAATHAHGNTVAIKAAKNKAIQSGKARKQDFQPSMVRSKAKAQAQKEERKAPSKDDDDAPTTAPKVSKKKLSKAALERQEEREALNELRRVIAAKLQAKSQPQASASEAPKPDDGDADA